jgi:hypothetical protein
VPFDIVGQQAQEDVGAHARAAAMVERADLQIGGLHRAEGALDPAEALIGSDD